MQGRPLIYQYGGSAGVTHDINRLQLTLRGSVDRSDYEDARLTSGAILSPEGPQPDAVRPAPARRLRGDAGLQALRPGRDRPREFDEKVDSNGYSAPRTA